MHFHIDAGGFVGIRLRPVHISEVPNGTRFHGDLEQRERISTQSRHCKELQPADSVQSGIATRTSTPGRAADRSRLFLQAWGVEIMFATISPYVHVSPENQAASRLNCVHDGARAKSMLMKSAGFVGACNVH